MILLEDLNELNKINRSILKSIAFSYNDKPMDIDKIMSRYGISNNSKVYINTLKDKVDGKSIHTWKHVTDVILADANVAGVILRSNKRQLLGIFKNKNNSRYILYPSEILRDIPKFYDTIGISDGQETSSDVSVRNKMAGVVKLFIETYPNAKKNWDILVISKDTSAEEKRAPRATSREGREVKPSEKYYSDYIESLKKNLKLRLEKYINSKIPNIENKEVLKQFLAEKNTLWVRKLKIFNTVYVLEDVDRYDTSVERGTMKVKAEYRISFPGKGKYEYPYAYSDVSNFFIIYELNGLSLEISGMNFGSRVSFEEGCEKILNAIKEEKNRNKN